MRIFKRLKEAENLLDTLVKVVSKLTESFVKTIKENQERDKHLAAHDDKIVEQAEALKKLNKAYDEQCKFIKAVLDRVEKLEGENRELKRRLPEYEEAVAKRVDDVWNRALQDIIDYNPMSQLKKEAGDE